MDFFKWGTTVHNQRSRASAAAANTDWRPPLSDRDVYVLKITAQYDVKPDEVTNEMIEQANKAGTFDALAEILPRKSRA